MICVDDFNCKKNSTILLMLALSRAASISSKIRNGAGLTLNERMICIKFKKYEKAHKIYLNIANISAKAAIVFLPPERFSILINFLAGTTTPKSTPSE